MSKQKTTPVVPAARRAKKRPNRAGASGEVSGRRPSAAARLERLRFLLFAAALVAATLAAYEPAWHGSPVWDDDAHMTRADLQGADGLRRIWVEPGATQQYYPLAHSAFWLEHRLFGDDTFGYHLVNVLLHALSALLLALILRRLGATWWWLAACLFALHPIEVESVAWISELKNVLSGALYLGAALVYLRFDESRGRGAYAAALVLFVLALLAKSVTATLPAALLVAFWWRSGRIGWRRDVVPLLPWFAVGIGAGLGTAWAERTLIGARGATFDLTLIDRGLVAGRAFWFYLASLAWPANLAFVYPRWRIDQAAWWQHLFPLAAVLLAGALWMLRRRTRAPLAAILFFGGTLVPALGFVNVYPFRYSFVADHFQYLAGIGIFALVAAALGTAAARVTTRQAAAAAVAAAVIVVPVTVATWNQSRDYESAEALYRATLERNPAAWLAHNNLGYLLLGRGENEEAKAHFRSALALNPDYAEAHNNMGYSLQAEGNLESAAAEFREAIRLEPNYAEAINNLGAAEERLGRLQDARADYERALALRPRFLQARVNLGMVLVRLDKPAEALPYLSAVADALPDDPDAHQALGVALQRLGRHDAAIAQFRAIVRLEPGAAAPHVTVGNALYLAGRLEEAVGEYRAAIAIDPGSAEAQKYLNAALDRLGER